jgi:dihydroorotase
MTSITVRKPDDFHNHLRQGEMMTHLVKETAKVFARTNVMPNTLPPIRNAEDLTKYHEELKAVGTDLEFLMTFKVMPETSPEMIPALKAAGAVAGKLYPLGVTTHSEDGVADIEALFPTFQAMLEEDLVLCLHGEVPGEDALKREEAFLPKLQAIHKNFPQLRIVLEHASSKAAVEAVKSMGDSISASVTVHHLVLTIEDVQDSAGSIHHPHHLCMPICKTDADRKALQEVVFSGHHKFFLGTDSAPHSREKKEAGHPPAGIYTTPVALPVLTELFEEAGKLDQLEAFTSQFGADFYQIPLNDSQIELVKESWIVSEEMFGVVPFRAGEQLSWKIS